MLLQQRRRRRSCPTLEIWARRLTSPLREHIPQIKFPSSDGLFELPCIPVPVSTSGKADIEPNWTSLFEIYETISSEDKVLADRIIPRGVRIRVCSCSVLVRSCSVAGHSGESRSGLSKRRFDKTDSQRWFDRLPWHGKSLTFAIPRCTKRPPIQLSIVTNAPTQIR